MENASKALLIAGGIILGIIIISAAVILYTNLTNNAKDYSSRPEAVKIQQINTNFEKYRGRTDITSQDIISVYNYIEEYQATLPHSITLVVSGDTDFPSTREICKSTS